MNKTKTIVNGIGVFASSMLVMALAVYIYSPVLGSDATDSLTTKVAANINMVASLTLDTNTLAFSVVPTDAGVFSSQPITATVFTNSLAGYELYFSSEDNTTNMTHSDSNVSSVIASDFEGTVTGSTMAKNKWGYSLNNTEFSKIPTLSNHAKIKDLDHFPSSSEKNTAVYIGTKISSDLMSGRYTKNVKFSVLAHEVQPTITDISYMQDMTSDICEATGMGAVATLEDARDHNTYVVKKLADNKCWMTQNLKIANTNITGSDSDIATGTSFTIPASDISAFGESSSPDPDEPIIVIDPTPTPTSDGKAVFVNSYGGYYNYLTATAGTVTSSTPAGKATSSICPKGWKLPDLNNDFDILDGSYQSQSDLYQGAPAFSFSGHIVSGTATPSVSDTGTTGHYWSTTISFANYAMGFSVSSTRTGRFTAMETFGSSIRCLAR